jgi:hypothetical protein
VLTVRINPTSARLDLPRKGEENEFLLNGTRTKGGIPSRESREINRPVLFRLKNQSEGCLDGVWEILSQQCIQRREETKTRQLFNSALREE